MSSLPLGQQQPPLMAINRQLYAAHSRSGSIGPLIGVLVVITILGVISGMIGRLCTGGKVFGYSKYDVMGWIERKWTSCIDRGIDRPPPPNPAPAAGAGSGANGRVPIAFPAEAAPQGGKQQAAEQQSTAEEP